MSSYNCKNYLEQPKSVDDNNKAHLEGTSVYNGNEYTAAQIDAVLAGGGAGTVVANQVVTSYAAPAAIAVAGKAVIAGGTGLAMTLAAPIAYAVCDINVLSLASGNVVVTTAAGTTFDGTNNTATFNAAADRIVIGYKSITQWEIHLNNSVVLSLV